MSEEKAAEAASLLGVGTWTRQGPATLVLRESAWVVLIPGLRKQVTEAAWDVLGRKPAPEEFLDLLVEAGELESADKLAALLFGFHDGTTGTFGVRGKTPIAVYTAEGSQQIAGTEEEPFVLTTLEGVRRVAFGDLPPEDPVGAPRVESGIVPVRGFVHMTVDPAELEEEERTALAAQVEQDGRTIEDPEAKKRRAERPAPTSKPAGSTGSQPLRRPPVATRKPGEMPPSLARGSSGGASASRSAAPDPTTSGPNMFDGLFGGGSAKPAAPAEPAAPAQPSAPAQPVPPAQPVAPAEPVASAEPVAPAVPAASTQAAAPPAAASPSAQAARPDGERAKSPAASRRRLVSTSLFDRKHRPSTPPARTGEETAEATPTVAEPPEAAPLAPPPLAPPQAARSSAAPISRRSATSPAATPRTPAAAIPTPDDPEDEDFSSPPTQIAPVEDEDEAQHSPTPTPQARPRRAAAPAPAASDLDNTGAYDDLFGKTVFRRIEDAAVRPPDEEDDDGEGQDSKDKDRATEDPTAAESTSGSLPAESTSGSSPAEPSPAVEPAPEPASAGGDFIDWVPGVGRAAPEIAQTAARRASAPPTREPTYPQVHMVERPPVPNTGSRPAPTGPSAPQAQPAPVAPYGGPMSTGHVGQQVGYPATPGQPQHYANGPANSGAAGHQVGFPGPQRVGSPNPGYPAPGHQAQQGRPSQQGDPAPGWGGSPNPPRPAPGSPAPRPGAPAQNAYAQQPSPVSAFPPRHEPAAQQRPAPQQTPAPQQAPAPQRGLGPGPGRHASAPHPVAPAGTPSAPVRAPHAAPATASGGGQVAGAAMALPGLVCPNGHANSPERSVCRVCAAPLQGETRTVARPPLGAVEISGGGRFVLDRSAIIGRRPRASRVSGNDMPQLITVDSPQQDISRSHLELRLEGWHVVALDLGTTNGTTLHREGYEPVRLRTREGMVLHDGDHLDLGDDVHLTFGERG